MMRVNIGRAWRRRPILERTFCLARPTVDVSISRLPETRRVKVEAASGVVERVREKRVERLPSSGVFLALRIVAAVADLVPVPEHSIGSRRSYIVSPERARSSIIFEMKNKREKLRKITVKIHASIVASNCTLQNRKTGRGINLKRGRSKHDWRRECHIYMYVQIHTHIYIFYIRYFAECRQAHSTTNARAGETDS